MEAEFTLLISTTRRGSETGNTFTVALPESDGVVADVDAEAIGSPTAEVPRATKNVSDSDGPSTAKVPGATGSVADGVGPSFTEVPLATEGVDKGDGLSTTKVRERLEA